MKCLIDCAYKINNTWDSFHKDVTKIKDTLKCQSLSLFRFTKPKSLIWTNCILDVDQVNSKTDKKRFCKLSYTGKYLE